MFECSTSVKTEIPKIEKIEEQDKIQYQEKQIINGVMVYESFRESGDTLWECLLQSMGRE